MHLCVKCNCLEDASYSQKLTSLQLPVLDNPGLRSMTAKVMAWVLWSRIPYSQHILTSTQPKKRQVSIINTNINTEFGSTLKERQ